MAVAIFENHNTYICPTTEKTTKKKQVLTGNSHLLYLLRFAPLSACILPPNPKITAANLP
jgi:hypothetical protein